MGNLFQRTVNVAPFAFDFSCLWLDEVKGIPLGILLILISTTVNMSIAFGAAQVPAIYQSPLSSNGLFVAAFTVLMMACVGLLSWFLIDRLGWATKNAKMAARIELIERDQKRILTVEKRQRIVMVLLLELTHRDPVVREKLAGEIAKLIEANGD